jgi:hypothetical protein
MRKLTPPKPAAARTTTIKYDNLTHRYYLDPPVPNMPYGDQLQINVDAAGHDRTYDLLVTITSQPVSSRPGSVNVHS